MNRDCDNCTHRKADGCEAWECEYEAKERKKKMTEFEKAKETIAELQDINEDLVHELQEIREEFARLKDDQGRLHWRIKTLMDVLNEKDRTINDCRQELEDQKGLIKSAIREMLTEWAEGANEGEKYERYVFE